VAEDKVAGEEAAAAEAADEADAVAVAEVGGKDILESLDERGRTSRAKIHAKLCNLIELCFRHRRPP
jgi:hypothetical protein